MGNSLYNYMKVSMGKFYETVLLKVLIYAEINMYICGLFYMSMQ